MITVMHAALWQHYRNRDNEFNFSSKMISDEIRTGSGPEKVRVVLETGNPGNSDQSPVPS